jgi:hypothetical protein
MPPSARHGIFPPMKTPKPKKPIETLILTIQEQRVILAPDLADIYGVETRALNQAVKRNAERFPEDFIFQLTAREFSALKDAGKVSSDGRAALRSQIVILESGRHAKYPPHAFTEHGALMAANVLHSKRAVEMSVFVIRAFVRIREHLIANAAILKRLAEIDKTLLEHDSTLRALWMKLQPLLEPPPDPPRPEIGFHIKEDAPPYRTNRRRNLTP